MAVLTDSVSHLLPNLKQILLHKPWYLPSDQALPGYRENLKPKVNAFSVHQSQVGTADSKPGSQHRESNALPTVSRDGRSYPYAYGGHRLFPK